MRGRLAVGTWLALAAGAVGAGTPARAQLPVFRAGTELVQIDVMVADKDGHSVTGLTKGDFEILDRGTRVPIEVLAEFHGDPHPAPVLGDVRRDVV